MTRFTWPFWSAIVYTIDNHTINMTRRTNIIQVLLVDAVMAEQMGDEIRSGDDNRRPRLARKLFISATNKIALNS